MPDLRNTLLNQLETQIEASGMAVVGVFASTAEETPFAYSVGAMLRNQPELLLIGVPLEVAHQVLNQLQLPILAGDEPAVVPETFSDTVFAGVSAYFAPVAPEVAEQTEYLNVLRAYCKRHQRPLPPVLQLVWPSQEGHFPWSADATDEYKAAQPFVGISPVAH